ncbi:MAG: RCC1 domain-containing protein [Bdellovibrionales bacterium]
MTISFTLNRKADQNVTFKWSTADGTALSTSDYVGKSAQDATIPIGADRTQIKVQTSDAKFIESSIYLKIVLSDIKGAKTSSSETTVTLKPNRIKLTGVKALFGSRKEDGQVCAIDGNGKPLCWGKYMTRTATPSGIRSGSLYPLAIQGLDSGVRSIAFGPNANCVVTVSGAAKCWGGNSNGELGNGTSNASESPVNVMGLESGVRSITITETMTVDSQLKGALFFAVMDSGAVRCWGGGQSSPVTVSGLSGIQSMATYSLNLAFLTSSGAVLTAKRPKSCSEVIVTSNVFDSGIETLVGGTYGACVLTSSKTVQCWGTAYSYPVSVFNLPTGTVRSLSGGSRQACAILTDGKTYCWNNGPSTEHGTFEVTHLPSVASQIESNWRGSGCALLGDETVHCWGDNDYGRLGRGGFSGSEVARPWLGLGIVAKAVVGQYAPFCAIEVDGNVRCWRSDWDQTTLPLTYRMPVIPSVNGTSALSGGFGINCALTPSAGVKCWTRDSRVYDAYGLASGIQQFVNHITTTCGLTFSGEVKCKGFFNYGKFGDLTTVSNLGTGNKQVAMIGTGRQYINDAGDESPCVVTSANAVVCSDYNGIPGMSSDIKSISGGQFKLCALTLAGGVKCWDRSTSKTTDIPGLATGVVELSTGYDDHSCVLMNSGAVKCWGPNSFGQLGNGSGIDSDTPVEVIGIPGKVQSISTGVSRSFAVTENGQIVTWGIRITSGQTGPVVIPVDGD